MIPIKVPPLGESIVEATISRWLRNEGESVAAGDPLVELETDKITVEVPALKSGVLARRLRAEGDVVKVDELLGELDESTTAAAPAPAAAASAAAVPSTAAAPSAAAPPPAGTSHSLPASLAARIETPRIAAGSEATVKASPAARRVAAETGIDLSSIEGTGRSGVVSKPDLVEQAGRPAMQRTTPTRQSTIANAAPVGASTAGSSAPAAPASVATTAAAPIARRPDPERAVPGGVRETREKMSTRRKRIAERLLESQHATAHLTTFNEIDMSAVMQLRDRSKARVEKDYGVKLTFMPFFVKAACIALKNIPIVNAQVDGDSILYRHYVNMGIAVASDQGLVVPNIRDADSKGLIEVSRDIAQVATRARDGKLTMDDLTGGTFTITNGGVFGSLVSTPIINFPQVGILGLHKIQDRPVAIDGRVEIRPMMYIALSYDHRIVDGQHSVLFLVRVKQLMEDPGSMLIE